MFSWAMIIVERETWGEVDWGVLQFVASLLVKWDNGRDVLLFDLHNVLPIIVEVQIEIEIVEIFEQGDLSEGIL